MAARRSPWITAAVLALAAALPHLLGLPRWRLLDGAQARRAFLDPFTGRPKARLWERRPVPTPAPAPTAPEAPPAVPSAPSVPAPEPGMAPVGRPPAPREPDPEAAALLTDPANALAPFHAALARVEAGSGLARVAHFGDSVVTGDLITGEVRARLQRGFGDGGPGWVYLQRPWEWYGRPGLTLKGRGWKAHSPVLTWRPDRAYGLAGIAFAAGPGAETTLATAPELAFERVEVHHLPQARPGKLKLQAGGAEVEVSTQGNGGPALQALDLEAPARQAVLRAQGDATAYGLVLERRGPGVVVDPLGQNGLTIHHLAGADAATWVKALRLRRPDLVVLAFGTNEVGYYNIPGPGYLADLREVVRRVREALPGAGILVMAPMDRGERRRDGSLGTMPNLLRIVEAQRRIAAELGLAFFDTPRAMGGEGAAVRWYQATPRLMTGDFTHPTRTGADRIARSLVDALVLRHRAWKAGRAPVSAPPAAPPPS